MRRLSPAAATAVLLLFTSTSSADWSSNFEVGKGYSDIVDIGHVGARKQVVLPSNQRNWSMLASETKTERLGLANAMVDGVFGSLVLANLGDNRQVHVLAYVQASVKPIPILYHSPETVLPQMCAERKSAVFQDLYKSIASRRKPKCLTIERIDLQSLSDAEHAALDKHSLSFSSGPMIRLTMATSDGRYGTLALAFTSTISADEEEAYIESLKKWGHQYVTSQLEDSLSRSLWEAPFKDPYPITVTGANPTSTAPVTQPAGAQPAPSSDDVFSMLEKLKSLHEQGILTDQEFNSKKAELLKRL